MGGPSVKPYQPINIWESVAMKGSNTRFYKQDQVDALYRRSLYTFWKRTAPHPSMEILNAPSREVFCVRRELTNTPLQAFVVMNDPQFVEASRNIAQNVILSSKDQKARINQIGRLLLSRDFSLDEIEVVQNTIKTTAQQFKANPEDAKKLITVGASKPNETIDAIELATWTMITSKILNLDEALCK